MTAITAPMPASAASYDLGSYFANTQSGYRAFARAVAPRKPLTVSQ